MKSLLSEKAGVLFGERIANLFNEVAETDNGCLNWTGRKSRKGYGAFSVSRTNWQAHRASYELLHPGFNRSLHVLHSCDNPSCVNPEHLFLGTNRDNVVDKIRKGRQAVGERVKKNKLTCESVSACRVSRMAGASVKSLAQEHEVSERTMSFAIIGRTWRHLSTPPATRRPGIKSIGNGIYELVSRLSVGDEVETQYERDSHYSYAIRLGIKIKTASRGGMLFVRRIS